MLCLALLVLRTLRILRLMARGILNSYQLRRYAPIQVIVLHPNCVLLDIRV